MTLHKLTAGDGYTYLIRQVAAADVSVQGTPSLQEYYSAKGEAPGVWMGAGMAGLGVTGEVTEQQMRNLFGQGLHPDAQRLEEQTLAELAGQQSQLAKQHRADRQPGEGGRPTAAGNGREKLRAAQRAGYLGQPFKVFAETSQWRDRLRDAYAAFETVDQHAPTEEQRQAIRTRVGVELFTEEYHRAPDSDHELSGFIARASRPQTTAVAGYDLSFSPVKSVSTLWAIAPTEVSLAIEAAHAAAVADSLAWLETAAGYTREGHNGVAQVDVKGFAAAVFTHRDSRAGDPDLHTHVAVANKVQTLAGKWLSLDGRMLHRMAVTASERYNTTLEAEISTRLGVTFADRATTPGKRPVREIVGVLGELNVAWSSRRTQIEAAAALLHGDFVNRHGRVPTATERIALHQQATLDTRASKHEPRSLAEQRQLWRAQAERVLGGERALETMLTDLGITAEPAPAAAPLTNAERKTERRLVAVLAARTVDTVAQSRAHWREANVEAEALRQVRGAGIDPARMVQVAARVTARAVSTEHCLPIGTDTDVDTPTPDALQRKDGESVFRIAGGQLFTSPAMIAAEQRLVTTAGRRGARTIGAGEVEIAALEWSANNGGRTLNPAQAAMVGELAVTDRSLMLALAPAGTGKTTVMGVLAAGWQSAGGTVLGLAPQASAAQELSAAIPGVHADTLDKLIFDLAEHPDPGDWEPWMAQIGADSLVIIDEAGLASTPKLDAAVAFITGRGGRVVLLGDDQQRAANGAGGVLRDIEGTHGALTLNEVMRFTDPKLGRASLALREGDPSIIGLLADRGELHAATPAGVVDAVHAAWAADIAAGADSVMIAPTLEMTSALNAKARAGRIDAGQVTGPDITLPNGDLVAAGDVIVTKRNKRSLVLGGGTDFVRNNYRWTVDTVSPDGSIRATHTRRGITRTLPAWYVADGHVRLGYAHTLASVQGMTVGKASIRQGTAHLVVTDAMTRNDLYPGLTRATDGTHTWVVTPGTGEHGDVITPATIAPPSPAETLAAVIARDGTPRSVTTEIAAAADPAPRLGAAAGAYRHSIDVAAQTRLGPDGMARLADDAETAVPGVTFAPAWDTLHSHLAVLAANGRDPIAELTAAANSRELETADDLAAVLDYRLDPTGRHSQPPGPLPWLPEIPEQLAAAPGWGDYLGARRDLVDQLATQVSQDAAGWTAATAPAWAIPYLSDPDLTRELALWRASHGTADDDLRPAGEKPRTIAGVRTHAALVNRAVTVAGGPTDHTDRWAAQLDAAGIAVEGDDYWPVLAARLSAADAAGINVTHLLDTAVNDRAPLPAEAAAGALWWRIADQLGPAALAAPNGQRLAPAWTAQLSATLGQAQTAELLTDRLWPVIVARIDSYTRTPQAGTEQGQVGRIVGDAAGMLAAHGPMRPSQQAAMLLANLDQLLGPAPAGPDEYDLPPDPADADLHPPQGAYRLLNDNLRAAAAGERTRTRRPEPVADDHAAAGPDVDLFDPERHVDPYTDLPNPDLDVAEPVEPDDLVDDIEPDLAAPVDLHDQAPAPEPEWADPTEPAPTTAVAEPAPVDEPDLAPAQDLPDRERGAALARAQAALDAAHTFWQQQAPASWVPAYIAGRGLVPAPFGHAPAGWTATTDHLTQLGFTRDEQLAAGLIRRSSRGTYFDQFRDRAMLPITAPDGPTAGFIGRANPAADPDRTPKYLNSPGTDLFDKSTQLYGLDPTGAAALRAGADLVIVEGPMDAQAVNHAHRNPDGHPPALVAVATSGTALTAGHLYSLHAVAPLGDRAVILALDNDPAGQAAAARAHRILTDAGVTHPHTVAALQGKDASELLQHQGPQAVRDTFNQRRPLADLVVDRALAKHPTNRWAEDRINALNDVAPVIAALPEDQRVQQVLRVTNALPSIDTATVIDRVMHHVPAPPAPETEPEPGTGADRPELPTPPTLTTRGSIAAQPGSPAPERTEQLGALLAGLRALTADVEESGVSPESETADYDYHYDYDYDADRSRGMESDQGWD